LSRRPRDVIATGPDQAIARASRPLELASNRRDACAGCFRAPAVVSASFASCKHTYDVVSSVAFVVSASSSTSSSASSSKSSF